MSSVASASLPSGERVAPGVLFRVSAVASAVAVGLVVVSAVLELGTTHWGIALVALPLLVANVVLARLAYPALSCGLRSSRSWPSSSRSRSEEWSRGAVTRRWAVGAARRGCGGRARSGARRRRGCAARRSRAARLRSRLPHAHEAADHDAPPAHRRGRDVRRSAGRAAARPLRRDHARARARLRRRLGAQSRPRPRHRRAHGQPHREATRRHRPRVARAGARVRDPAVGDLVRAARLGGERADGGARARREPLLRPRLHPLAQALDAAEHRHRRRGGSGAAARRLRGRDRDRSRCRRSGCSSSSSSGRHRTSGRSR